MDIKVWNNIIRDIHAQIELDDCLNTSMEVELHKGRIWVDSQPGRGARFSFTLPKDIRTIQ